MMENKNYNVLHQILMDIHKEKVKLEEEPRVTAVIVFTKVRDDVMNKLTENGKIFKELGTILNHRGSYFAGVKVLKPDEFDVDITLKLPLDYSKIKIENTEPGFISLNIKNEYETKMRTPTWADKYGFLESIMDKEGYLSQEKLRQHTESILNKAYGVGEFQIEVDGKLYKCKQKKNGPAFTFCIKLGDDGGKIDIDFVINILIPGECNVWPPKPVRIFTSFPGKFSSKNFWMAVPKPSKAGNARSWRMSFASQEDHILHSSDHLKVCYRLLKTLRSCQKWNISSYHFATLFLWEAERREVQKDSTFWKNNVGFLFIYFLRELITVLEKQQLSFFWHSKCNMIEDLAPGNITNIKGRISGIERKIHLHLNNKSDLEDYLRQLFDAQRRKKELGDILEIIDPLNYPSGIQYKEDSSKWLMDFGTIESECTQKEMVKAQMPAHKAKDVAEIIMQQKSTQSSMNFGLVDCSPSTLGLVKEGLNAIISHVNREWPAETSPDVLDSRRKILELATHVRALLFKEIPVAHKVFSSSVGT